MASTAYRNSDGGLCELLRGVSINDTGGKDPDWCWQTFLTPLEHRLTAESNTTDLKAWPSDNSLARKCMGLLEKQHFEKMEEKKEEVAIAEKDLKKFTESVGCSIGEFSQFNNYWKRYETALNIKSDREISGSKWTVEMLEWYIKCEDVEIIQPTQRVHPSYDDEELAKTIVENYDLLNKAICSRSEYDIRIVLDGILIPLCTRRKLTLRTEHTIKCELLPNNRYDYIIYHDDQPIGAVEAKRPGSLNPNSVAQLIAQLLLLSSMNVMIPQPFYFGVLSDGNQFIFVGLSEKKLLFFQTDPNFLEVATVESDGLGTIVHTILWYIDWAMGKNCYCGRGSTSGHCSSQWDSGFPSRFDSHQYQQMMLPPPGHGALPAGFGGFGPGQVWLPQQMGFAPQYGFMSFSQQNWHP